MAKLVCYKEECSILGCDEKNCSLRKVEYEKKDFMRKLNKKDKRREHGDYIIVLDAENDWGPIVSKKLADEMWARFKSSGLSFEEWSLEFC